MDFCFLNVPEHHLHIYISKLNIFIKLEYNNKHMFIINFTSDSSKMVTLFLFENPE